MKNPTKPHGMIAASNGVTSAILGAAQIEKLPNGDANIKGDVETRAVDGEVIVTLKALGITFKLDPSSATELSINMHKNAALARKQRLVKRKP